LSEYQEKDLSRDGKILKDSVRFLFDGAFEDSSHCLEKLKEFMDPVLGGDYSLGDAMCLAFLAKGCMEEDPHHLPTMNHVLKAFKNRIVYSSYFLKIIFFAYCTYDQTVNISMAY